MNIFLNDLSFHGQFSDLPTFRHALEELIRCRDCASSFNHHMRVPRSIIERQALANLPFRQAVQALGDTNLLRAMMVWLNKNGPFVDDELTRDPNEYLTLADETVVSEEVIGEAAQRHFQQQLVSLVSATPSKYTYNPLEVIWHKSDAEQALCELDNFWQQSALQTYLEQRRSEPRSWREFVEQLPARFPQITFFPDLLDHLEGEPFKPYVVGRSFELLAVIDELTTCFDENGKRTERGHELIKIYFHGDRARFSDASESEKNDPRMRAAMTFRYSSGQEMECFWHGKIQTPPYRLHFTYPIEYQQPVYLAYIGQKLTKK